MNRALDNYQTQEYEAEARRRVNRSDSLPGALHAKQQRERNAEWDRESVLLIRREQRRFAAKQGF